VAVLYRAGVGGRIMSYPNWPRSEIIKRTFPIRYRGFSGTCFTIDVEGKQYILTAKHVVEGVGDVDEIEIGRVDKWITLTITRIDCSVSAADVVVLAPSRLVSENNKLICEPGWFYGQDVFFIGFPFGFIPLNDSPGHPLPFCKKATTSYYKEINGQKILILSGQSNSGFSGAPIFYCDQATALTHVIGVLTGDTRQLIAELGVGADKEAVYESAGFIEAVCISHALEAIRLRPIGADF
jgi:hypothetical protein